MQIYFYNPDDFDSFGTAIQEKRIIGAMAVFFQVSYAAAWTPLVKREQSLIDAVVVVDFICTIIVIIIHGIVSGLMDASVFSFTPV